MHLAVAGWLVFGAVAFMTAQAYWPFWLVVAAWGLLSLATGIAVWVEEEHEH